MTGRGRVADAIRVAYGIAIREENPRTALHIAAAPLASLPHERQRKWLAMAAAAEREIATELNRRVSHTVDTLRGMECGPDEPCLSTREVLAMLGHE